MSMGTEFLQPETERARSRAASGTCADGGGDAPSALFHTGAPLAARGSGSRHGEGRFRTPSWVRAVGFWAGEIIACASLFGTLFILLFIGGAIQ
ncbi:hypothetical protein QO034_06345 [Sedimentitalea sp. JM2-8]|uniref:Uncharacterized protein n=1 Tax=Sedimentitalea xiamensis TaxID=3050037 RepID=A0ABT7FCG7_9RHOB|nr:hypothetical protein [Sedimentitalea xiamensis]MDK3072723.1 hypothetical protein [Sedimentitalea xiamensis]